MDLSPQKRPSASTSLVAPVGHMLGHKFLSLARSHLPVAAALNKSKMHHRTFLGVAPIPFAPLVDTHAFQPPPPPYSFRPDDDRDEANEHLSVPYNTPAELTTSNSYYARPVQMTIGLGFEGVERGDGERFDGLGRLSEGFRAALAGSDVSTRDALREQIHRMLTERSRRRRTLASELPAMQHDVFYASVEVEPETNALLTDPNVKIRIRRKSVASPTPGGRGWERSTISSELKRAASMERRASLRV